MQNEYAMLDGQIAYLERREAALAMEEASLPTVGSLRPAWRRVRDELGRTRERLQDARSGIVALAKFDEVSASLERHLEAMVRRKRFHVV